MATPTQSCILMLKAAAAYIAYVTSLRHDSRLLKHFFHFLPECGQNVENNIALGYNVVTRGRVAMYLIISLRNTLWDATVLDHVLG